MKTVAIIQARMGSSRLPAKVLLPLAGRPVICRVIERARASGVFDEIVVATTDLVLDDELADVARAAGAKVVRGSETDVLGRYVLAAEASDASEIVRITADCPLIDPSVLRDMVRKHQSLPRTADLTTNARVRTYPRGLDAEIFSRNALEAAHRKAGHAHQREHVTPFLYEHPERFKIVDFVNTEDLSALRLTLDTPDDFDLLKVIYSAAAAPDDLCLADVLELLNAHPEWSQINAGIKQKEYWEQS